MKLQYGTYVQPGERPKLKAIDTDPPKSVSEEFAKAETTAFHAEIEKLQELLYAAASHGVLIVLQGMDTSGKDGTIRKLSTCLNVQSCQVASFKKPSEIESGHDFLWRIHQHSPAKGHVSIFNRSQYEDVLVVRVHDLVPKKVWKKRYDRINELESLLFSEANTLQVKFYLHISKKEQEERLIAREQEKDKEWKLSANDWKERELWNDYAEAFEDAFEECSKAHSPWVIIPADKKWYRDLCVSEALVKLLEPYREEWRENLVHRGKAEMAELAKLHQLHAEGPSSSKSKKS